VDLEALFAREGDAPVRQLQAALQGKGPHHSSAAPDGANSCAHPAGMGSDATTGAEAAGSQGGCSGEELEALKQALRGVVWTRSMRRMYTLVDRCARGM